MLKRNITIIAMLLVTLTSSYATAKSRIRMGMSRSQLAKALPVYAKAFENTDPNVQIKGYYYYGMKGDAAFLFMQGDKLLLFTWEYKQSGQTLDNTELQQYNNVLKGLESDYGTTYKKEVSELDSRVGLWYWRLPTASGHTSYTPMKTLKFQIADNTWLESIKPH